MAAEWLGFLVECDLFKNIDLDELRAMLGCLSPKVRKFRKDGFLTVAGTEFTGVGIVLSGKAVVTRENAAGKRVIISMLGPGEMFGEMAAFSEKRVWPASVVAQEPCMAAFFPPERIVGGCSQACRSHRQLIMNMLKILSNKAIMLSKKVEYLAMKSIRGKISFFLLEHYQRAGKATFMLPMNRDEMADFLGVTRPSLSREMSRMRDEGLIDFHRSSVRILDVEALQEMVDD